MWVSGRTGGPTVPPDATLEDHDAHPPAPALVVVLCGLLAGCDGATAPSASSAPDLPHAGDRTRDRESLDTRIRDAAPDASYDTSYDPLAPPPPPTGVRIERQGCYWGSDSTGITGTCTTTITWKKAGTKGTEIRAVWGDRLPVGMTERPGDGSCLVKHGSVPHPARRLIAKAPASKCKIVWTGPPGETCPSRYRWAEIPDIRRRQTRRRHLLRHRRGCIQRGGPLEIHHRRRRHVVLRRRMQRLGTLDVS